MLTAPAGLVITAHTDVIFFDARDAVNQAVSGLSH